MTVNNLIKDHQFDSLVATLEQEKDKAEKNYFESLINAAASNSERTEDSFTPVELVLKKHLKQGLAAHEKFFQSLKKSYQQNLNTLQSKTENAIAELHTHGLSQEELMLQTQDLDNTLSRRKDELKNELDSCAKMVADAYDKYLTSHIPELNVLPVKCSIYLTSKNIMLADVTFNPTDCIKEVRDLIEARMILKNNPVYEWGDDVRFFLFGPFSKCSPCEMNKIMADMLISGGSDSDVQILAEGCRLGLQYGMKPGSQIVIYGSLKLESDLPKKCFVEVFKKGEGQKVDYFSCQDCGFKWICRSCMEVCHQDHEMVPYIMGHQPAWACCYCPKKKKCKIQTT